MQNNPVINSPKLKNLRKLHRNYPTPWEVKLWGYLKGRQLDGYKFRRQTSINNYIVDFVCLELKLVIELDGSGHLHERQKKRDKIRQKDLEFWGFKVIRFFNNEIDENMEGVLYIIAGVCQSRKKVLTQ